MKSQRVDVAIVGAGPYGLSVAAHLAARGVSYRLFGSPMRTWRCGMPEGMLLRSPGFGSDLSDPAGALWSSTRSATSWSFSPDSCREDEAPA